MKNVLRFLCISLVCLSTLTAGFYFGGTMKSRNLNLSVGGVLENNGNLIGTETATISCNSYEGKGVLESPLITLTTDVFKFTGTIDCSNQCTIYVKEKFDTKMFKRKGKGKFDIIVTGDDHSFYDFSDGYELSVDGCLLEN